LLHIAQLPLPGAFLFADVAELESIAICNCRAAGLQATEFASSKQQSKQACNLQRGQRQRNYATMQASKQLSQLAKAKKAGKQQIEQSNLASSLQPAARAQDEGGRRKQLSNVGVGALKQGYPLLQYEDAVPARLSLAAW
jgi:hypothetical protein